MLRYFLILLVVACAVANASELVETPVVLTLSDNSQTTFGYGFSGSDADEATIDYRGNVEVTVRYDPITLTPSGIRLTGGSITTSDFEIASSGHIVIPNYGNFRSTIDIEMQDVAMGVTTSQPWLSVPANGLFNAGSSGMNVVSGTATVRTVSRGLDINETQVLDVTSEDFGANAFNDSQMILLIEQIASDALERRLRFTLSWSTDAMFSEQIPDTSTSFIAYERGTVTAVGERSFPGPFAAWGANHGIPPWNLDERNSCGLPYTVLYALDLPADCQRLPLRVDSKSRTLIIEFPEGGLRAALRAEINDTLNPEGWRPLESRDFAGTGVSFAAGASEEVWLQLPTAGFRFLRFAAEP